MTFYRIERTAYYGIVPDDGAVLDMASLSPFSGLILSKAALAEVLRLHDSLYDGGRRADLSRANLSGTNLIGVNLARANLFHANLAHAKLAYAKLAHSGLAYANFVHADLNSADLTGANLAYVDLDGANLTDANLTEAVFTGVNLNAAIGIVSPEEEEATLAAAIAAIAAEPENWLQRVWHDRSYSPATASAVGSCGAAHCLAGWMQALLPLDHPFRSFTAARAGWALAPRAAQAGWFSAITQPDLQARVDAAKAM